METIRSQLEEDRSLGYISDKEYEYLEKNIYELSKRTVEMLDDNNSLDKELSILGENIQYMLAIAREKNLIEDDCESETI